MKDKLNALPDDALIRLKMQIDAEFKSRRSRIFAPGKLATFFSEKYDRDVLLKITGKGPKNYLANECDKFGNPVGRGQWRIHPSFLMPVLPEVKAPAPAVGAGKDRPAATAAGAW
jgi:hypothetical protein